MHSPSVQGLHAPVVVSVINRAAHGAQLPEHGQHQVFARIADLFVRDQSRRQQPVTRSHGLVGVVDQVFQLLAQISHFVLLVSRVFAWIEVSGVRSPLETLKHQPAQGAV